MEARDMREQHLHVTDENLLLHASAELSTNSSDQVRAHLEGCASCRTRLDELESALAEVGMAHRQVWEELPPAAESHIRLKTRLTELGMQGHRTGSLLLAWDALVEHRTVALLGASCAACLLLAIWLGGPTRRSQTMTSLGHWEEPDLRITPGATVPVTENDVCGTTERTVPVVPVSLKRKVFELYGVTPPQPNAYEVDYLITPELGGATDIRNLWPEPYQDTVWNAHVKDQLEDRLHRMVCRGDVDLATAQHDISTDWIAAYRKYFHADRPVTDKTSSSNFSSLRRSPPST